jgi:signal transduction histidine kinase
MEQEIPIWVEADFSKIQNVLLNLLGNAIKYTNDGFIKLKIYLEN